ncbi:MAG: hypothetical protein NTV32_03960 [Gammaproteobacteria bacterium]|nr:hypothetical protein [Gammaproteobacteria bacterium]
MSRNRRSYAACAAVTLGMLGASIYCLVEGQYTESVAKQVIGCIGTIGFGMAAFIQCVTLHNHYAELSRRRVDGTEPLLAEIDYRGRLTPSIRLRWQAEDASSDSDFTP